MKNIPLTRLAGLLWLLSLVLLVTACVGLRGPRKTEKSSSVVDFLYPQQTEPLITPGVTSGSVCCG